MRIHSNSFLLKVWAIFLTTSLLVLSSNYSSSKALSISGDEILDESTGREIIVNADGEDMADTRP